MGRGVADRVVAGAQELPLTATTALDLFSPEFDSAPAAPEFTVSQLGRALQELLRGAFESVWLTGEVARYRPSQAGHHYFDLIEKGDDDRIVGTLSAVIWRGEWARIRPVLDRAGQRLAEGLAVRCRVSVDFYPPGGRLQVQVREVDPAFTLGQLERRRRETLAELAAAGLLELNRSLPLPDLPLTIGLISSQGSAAYHDFLATLRESGFAFRVLFVHAAVQGVEAERDVVSALELLGNAPVDAIALVRGGAPGRVLPPAVVERARAAAGRRPTGRRGAAAVGPARRAVDGARGRTGPRGARPAGGGGDRNRGARPAGGWAVAGAHSGAGIRDRARRGGQRGADARGSPDRHPAFDRNRGRPTRRPRGGVMTARKQAEPSAEAVPQQSDTVSFSASLRELEAILARIEGEEVDLDRLAAELERAAGLLEVCRDKIRKAELEVSQIVQRLEPPAADG